MMEERENEYELQGEHEHKDEYKQSIITSMSTNTSTSTSVSMSTCMSMSTSTRMNMSKSMISDINPSHECGCPLLRSREGRFRKWRLVATRPARLYRLFTHFIYTYLDQPNQSLR